MKSFKNLPLLVSFLLGMYLSAQEPTDCFDSVVVCGNSSVNLDVNGVGLQELNNSNSCASQENNSIWLKVSVISEGTLGFTLSPNSSAISEDYDFFVFGPNVSCNNLGQAIRCSTTNPQAAGQSNNRTGMNGSESDTSEGPGEDGNSFVRWLDVRAGDSYFIVIDRPIGNSPFSLEWTGSAEFSDPPVNAIPFGETMDLERCDVTAPFDDGLTLFNLDLNTPLIIGTQENTTVSYHLTESDANIDTQPLPANYSNVSNPQNIYYRITNTITQCFDVGSFTLNSNLGPDYNDVGSLETCDNMEDGNDSNGLSMFDLDAIKSQYVSADALTNVNITYHRTTNDAENSQNPLNENYVNSSPNTERIFVRIEDRFNPNCKSITGLDLIVNPLPNATASSIIQCDEDGIADSLTRFNITEIELDIVDSLDQRIINYYETLTDAMTGINAIDGTNYSNIRNPQLLYAKVMDTNTSCFRVVPITLEVSLSSANNATLQRCDDSLEDGFQTFDLEEAHETITSGLISDLDIQFFATYNEALLEVNPLPSMFTNTEPYQQVIYARVENANACYGISEIELTVFEIPNIENEATDIYCLNSFPQPITLEAGLISDSVSDYQYLWSTLETTPTINVNSPGTYSVEVSNRNGCSKSRSILVTASNTASITDINVTDATNNNNITVFAEGEGIYEFALDHPGGPYQPENIFENVSSGFHTVFVRDINGCGTVEEVVSVVGFPKFFTPNADGFNDYWQIDGVNSQFQANSRLKIYDRFGKLLKEVDPLGAGWDGTFNGHLLPTDDYWFSATLEDGRELTGHFSLKR